MSDTLVNLFNTNQHELVLGSVIKWINVLSIESTHQDEWIGNDIHVFLIKRYESGHVQWKTNDVTSR